jgi:hypothetical protein
MDNFIEKQPFFRHWWWLIIVPMIIAITPVALNGLPAPSAAIGPVIMIVAFIVFFVLALHSRITPEGIYMRFNMQLKPRQIAWSEIKSVEVVKYSPLIDYGGWGYRKGWGGKKQAYNVSGNMGLKITLADGRIVLLGTREPEKMQEYLYYLKTKYQLSALSGLVKP